MSFKHTLEELEAFQVGDLVHTDYDGHDKLHNLYVITQVSRGEAHCATGVRVWVEPVTCHTCGNPSGKPKAGLDAGWFLPDYRFQAKLYREAVRT